MGKKKIGIKIFQNYVYEFHYKGNGLAETPKLSCRTAGFRGTQFERH
jgi:hypothetical protein